LACFYVSEVERNARRRLWFHAGFYAAVGASILAKGLVGLIIPFGVVGSYFLMRRSWPDRRTLYSLLWGIPLLIAVAALWYGPVIALHGRLFIDEFFIQHHFARFVSNKYHHPQPFYFYLAVMILLAFPWTPFMIASFRTVKPSAWGKNDALTRFHILALAWLIVPVVFFSLSVSKLPGYVLPALPAATLLTGKALVEFLQGERLRIAIRATGISMLCVVIAGVIYARQLHLVSNAWLIVMAAPLLLGGLFVLMRTNQRRASVIVVIFAVVATTVLSLSGLGDFVGERESTRRLIQLASERGYGDAPVYGLHTIEYTAEFYAPGRFVHDDDGKPVRLEGPQQVRKISQEANRAVLVIVPV
jgi:4-amino-4-deoxy-L-arabinose transferase-like glycosyltransferase